MNQSIINKLIYILVGILISLIGILIFYFVQQRYTKPQQQNKPAVSSQQLLSQPIQPVKLQGIGVIESYYKLLQDKKLEEAYAMHKKPKLSLAEFKKLYKNIEFIFPYSFKEIKQNRYKFFVDYKNIATLPTRYEIVMEVSEEKIQTISAKNKLIWEKITFDQFTAYVECRPQIENGKSTGYNGNLILKKDEEEIFIENLELNCAEEMSTNLKFSPQNNYLIYINREGAGNITLIYDIKNKKKINLGLRATNWAGFAKNEDYFIACAYTDLDEIQYGSVYKLPNFILKYDAFKDGKIKIPASGWVNGIDCQYNNTKNTAIFNLEGGYYDQANDKTVNIKKSVEYDLNTGKITYF